MRKFDAISKRSAGSNDGVGEAQGTNVHKEVNCAGHSHLPNFSMPGWSTRPLLVENNRATSVFLRRNFYNSENAATPQPASRPAVCMLGYSANANRRKIA